MSKHSDSEILKKTSLWDMASICFCRAHPYLKFLALSLSLATRWISWAQLLSQSPKMSTVCSSLLPSGFQKRRGLVGSMAGWASGSQIPRTTADVCLCSFCSVNNFSRYLYDTWCAVLLVVQIPPPRKVLLWIYLSRYLSLKKRYASPIGFSGLCSPGRVTFKKKSRRNVCAVSVVIQIPSE